MWPSDKGNRSMTANRMMRAPKPIQPKKRRECSSRCSITRKRTDPTSATMTANRTPRIAPAKRSSVTEPRPSLVDAPIAAARIRAMIAAPRPAAFRTSVWGGRLSHQEADPAPEALQFARARYALFRLVHGCCPLQPQLVFECQSLSQTLGGVEIGCAQAIVSQAAVDCQ